MYAWINPIYLAEETQATIRQQFEDDSEIQLENFLLPDKYEAVSAALRQLEEWEVRGPANRRRTERCRPERLPPVVAECVTLLRSEAMFLVLSQLTGLTLHPLAAAARADSRSVNGAPGGSQQSDSDTDDEKGQRSNGTPEPGAAETVHRDRCYTWHDIGLLTPKTCEG